MKKDQAFVVKLDNNTLIWLIWDSNQLIPIQFIPPVLSKLEKISIMSIVISKALINVIGRDQWLTCWSPRWIKNRRKQNIWCGSQYLNIEIWDEK